MACLSPKERARFIAKTAPTGDCLNWTGFRNSDGYGVCTVRSRQWRAHRLAYTHAYGPIPAGLIVRHTCDNPACVNPTHLVLGSDADNARDKAVRQRSRAKLTNKQVRSIRADARTLREIASDYRVSASAICLIKSGQRRQYVGG